MGTIIGNRSQPSILKLLMVGLITVLIVVYFIVAVTTQDILWLWPRFDAQPSAVVVYCYGSRIEIEAEDSRYPDLVSGLHDGLFGLKHWTELSLSQATLDNYRDEGGDEVVVEYQFPTPVRIHSHYRLYSNVEALIVPLEGRHADAQSVFGLSRGRPSAGSFHLSGTVDLRNSLRDSGLCP